MTQPIPIANSAPDEPFLTGYDMSHLMTYLRLLDADAEGADWREVARIVLNLDAENDRDRTKRVWQSHLARAKWMTRSAIDISCEAVHRNRAGEGGRQDRSPAFARVRRDSVWNRGLSPPDRTGRRQSDRHDPGKWRCARIGQVTAGKNWLGSMPHSGSYLDDGNGKTGGIGSVLDVNNDAKHRQDAQGENRLIVDDHVKTPNPYNLSPSQQRLDGLNKWP